MAFEQQATVIKHLQMLFCLVWGGNFSVRPFFEYFQQFNYTDFYNGYSSVFISLVIYL